MGDKTDAISRDVIEKLTGIKEGKPLLEGVPPVVKWVFIVCTTLGIPTTILYAKSVANWLVRDQRKVEIDNEVAPIKEVVLDNARSTRRTELMVERLLREKKMEEDIKEVTAEVKEETRQDSIRAKLGKKPSIFEKKK